MHEIKFGTDGWRAVIADTYTFENVERVARATGQWIKKNFPERLSAVVGYDTRFLGEAFAERTARVLASQGIHVRLSDSFVTTPAVSWAANAYECAAGVVITASHNPPQYNGFKIKSHHGGPADPAAIAEVEAELERLDRDFDLRPLADLEEEGRIERIALRNDYTFILKDRLDIEAIKKSGLKIGCDAMFGAGQGILPDLLSHRQVLEIRNEVNPWMHGRAPEPIERNLEYFSRVIREEKCDVGLAFDGDADRIGMLDEEGRFVDSHKILSLIVRYLHEEKGLTGSIVKTFSTTDMLDRMAERFSLPIETTKIGFKYIAPMIVEGDVLAGGEESGGLAVKGHIAERDGIYIGLTVVEMMVHYGKKLSELVEEIQDEFGPLHFARHDLYTTADVKERFLRRIAAEAPRELAGRTVDSVEDLDGTKLRFADGWLMFRPSGTEPVLRIYAEASSPDAAEELVRAGVEMVEE